jgi:membrane-bound lytic murein transglycosylase F
MYLKYHIRYILVAVVVLLLSCTGKFDTADSSHEVDLETILQTDTLRIGTIAGPVSYFYYRDEMMGFDYEMAQNLADSLKVTLKIVEAESETELTEMLASHKIDIAAYNFQQTKALKQQFYFVLALDDSYQVLVQPLNIKTFTNTIDIKDITVTVAPGSAFEQRISQLNEETGNSFNVQQAADSLTQEELIEQVATGKIGYTVADIKVARLYKSYYKKIDVRLQVGFYQRNGWLVRKESVNLRKAIEQWGATPENELLISNLNYKYLRNSLYFAQKKIKIPKGAISPYDHLFKKYAPEINWEWQLVAAVAFHESRFDSTSVSWAGAAGIMQLMPRTAANFGLNRKNIMNPEKNIEAGVQYIKSLNLTFSKIENKQERIKFILASYNSGPAHILDARALAEKYGKNKNVWFGHVEEFLIKKSEPEFYNDEVVKYGRFRADETVNFVERTLRTFEKYKSRK